MKRLATAALSLVVFAAPALAQGGPAKATSTLANTAVVDGDAEWTLRAGPKLVRALESPSAAVRAKALETAGEMVIASGGAFDVRPAVPALLQVLREDDDWRLRVMALTVLHASQDEGVMMTLRDETTRPAPFAVQRTLLAVLADHYGPDELRRDARVATLAQALIDYERNGERDRSGLLTPAG